METADRRSQLAYARLAGVMYLVVDALDALFVGISGRLGVPGDIVATAHRVTESQLLYRVSATGVVLAALCTVLIGVGLYGALKPVDRTLALTGLVFRTAEGALFAVQATVAFAFLKLYAGIDASGFGASQLSALASVRSAVMDTGYDVSALFFSLGSAAFFYLFVKSGYIPRWLAWLGLVGSLLGPVASVGSLAFGLAGPAYWAFSAPIAVAEVLTAIWLLRGLDLRAEAKAGVAPGAAA